MGHSDCANNIIMMMQNYEYADIVNDDTKSIEEKLKATCRMLIQNQRTMQQWNFMLTEMAIDHFNYEYMRHMSREIDDALHEMEEYFK